MRVVSIGTQLAMPSTQVSFKDERRNKAQQGQEDMPQLTSNLNFASAVEPVWKQVSKIAQRYVDGWQMAALNGLR